MIVRQKFHDDEKNSERRNHCSRAGESSLFIKSCFSMMLTKIMETSSIIAASKAQHRIGQERTAQHAMLANIGSTELEAKKTTNSWSLHCRRLFGAAYGRARNSETKQFTATIVRRHGISKVNNWRCKYWRPLRNHHRFSKRTWVSWLSRILRRRFPR